MAKDIVFILVEAGDYTRPIVAVRSPETAKEFLPGDAKERHFSKSKEFVNREEVGRWSSEINGCDFVLVLLVVVK